MINMNLNIFENKVGKDYDYDSMYAVVELYKHGSQWMLP